MWGFSDCSFLAPAIHFSEQLEEALFPWGLEQPRFPWQEALSPTQAVGLWAPPCRQFTAKHTHSCAGVSSSAGKAGFEGILGLRFMWETKRTLSNNLFLCVCCWGDVPSPHISQGHSVRLLPRCSIAVWRLWPRSWTLEKRVTSWGCPFALLFYYMMFLLVTGIVSTQVKWRELLDKLCRQFRLTSLSYEEQILFHFILPEDHRYHQETLGALPFLACLCHRDLSEWKALFFPETDLPKCHLPDECLPTPTMTNIWLYNLAYDRPLALNFGSFFLIWVPEAQR